MGVYFDKTSSGVLNDNTIVGRKGVGADTEKEVTITGNDITFTNMGIELHDGTTERETTIVINTSSEQDVELEQYTVSENTFDKVGK